MPSRTRAPGSRKRVVRRRRPSVAPRGRRRRLVVVSSTTPVVATAAARVGIIDTLFHRVRAEAPKALSHARFTFFTTICSTSYNQHHF
jgi:hypothetical protein